MIWNKTESYCEVHEIVITFQVRLLNRFSNYFCFNCLLKGFHWVMTDPSTFSWAKYQFWGLVVLWLFELSKKKIGDSTKQRQGDPQ